MSEKQAGRGFWLLIVGLVAVLSFAIGDRDQPRPLQKSPPAPSAFVAAPSGPAPFESLSAEQHLAAAIQLIGKYDPPRPDDSNLNLASLLAGETTLPEAAKHLEAISKTAPQAKDAAYLGRLLSKQRDRIKVVRAAQKVLAAAATQELKRAKPVVVGDSDGSADGDRLVSAQQLVAGSDSPPGSEPVKAALRVMAAQDLLDAAAAKARAIGAGSPQRKAALALANDVRSRKALIARIASALDEAACAAGVVTGSGARR